VNVSNPSDGCVLLVGKWQQDKTRQNKTSILSVANEIAMCMEEIPPDADAHQATWRSVTPVLLSIVGKAPTNQPTNQPTTATAAKLEAAAASLTASTSFFKPQTAWPQAVTIASMLPTTIRSPPSLDDFTLLSDFQSQTPNSFVDGKPILHLHLTGVTAQIPKSVASQLGAVFSSGTTQGSATNGASEEVLEQEVDVFVSSEYVIGAGLPLCRLPFADMLGVRSPTSGLSQSSAARLKRAHQFLTLRYPFMRSSRSRIKLQKAMRTAPLHYG
jgi:hypothetical protein